MANDDETRATLNKALLAVEGKYPDSAVDARLDGETVVLQGTIGAREQAVFILEMLGQSVGSGFIIDASRLSVEGAVLASSDTLSFKVMSSPGLRRPTDEELELAKAARDSQLKPK